MWVTSVSPRCLKSKVIQILSEEDSPHCHHSVISHLCDFVFSHLKQSLTAKGIRSLCRHLFSSALLFQSWRTTVSNIIDVVVCFCFFFPHFNPDCFFFYYKVTPDFLCTSYSLLLNKNPRLNTLFRSWFGQGCVAESELKAK